MNVLEWLLLGIRDDGSQCHCNVLASERLIQRTSIITK